MNPNEYQKLAMRTKCSQQFFIAAETNQIIHAVIGMQGEVGELSASLERWLWYKQPKLDKVNMREELGDLLWYIAEACESLDTTMESVMESNIRKLRKRYPCKFDQEMAREKNRNREAEAAAIERETVGEKLPTPKEPKSQVSKKEKKRITSHLLAELKTRTKMVDDTNESKESSEYSPMFERHIQKMDSDCCGGCMLCNNGNSKKTGEQVEGVRRSTFGNKYSRLCKVCGIIAVHDSSKSCICFDCAADLETAKVMKEKKDNG